MNFKQLSYSDLTQCVTEAGLEIFGVTGAEALKLDKLRLEEWQSAGYSADMRYMQREPDLLSSPLRLLPEARSIISLIVPYGAKRRSATTHGYGRIARYAWGLDYHKVLKTRLKELVKIVSSRFGDFVCREFSDSVPLLERAVATRAGLGFVGKNTMLIRPGVGSLFFLAEIISDLEIVGTPEQKKQGACGVCSRCIEICPTQALVSEHRLDARRCISYLTIEKRGTFNIWERRAIGEWLFGCDLCQECCPFNHAALKLEMEPLFTEFGSLNGSGPELSLQKVLQIRDDIKFKAVFGHTPLARTGRQGLLRNAACVIANTGFAQGIESLINALINDSSGIVRQHCAWAIGMLQKNHNILNLSRYNEVIDIISRDPDVGVKAEIKLEDGGFL